MDVALINPPTGMVLMEDGVFRTAPPLGLGYLTSMVDDLDVRVFDLEVDELGVGELVDTILDSNPLITGLYVSTLTLPVVYNIINLAFKDFPVLVAP